MSVQIDNRVKSPAPAKKLKILVVFGGVSSEHEISLRSAQNIVMQLDRNRYDVYQMGIRKTGEMLLYGGDATFIGSGKWEQHPSCQPCVISSSPLHHGLLLLPEGNTSILSVDCVIPVLHGKNGEDGTLQGLLDLANIPYVGCGMVASAACMDKEMTRLMLTQAGIRMAKAICVTKTDLPPDIATQVAGTLGFPVFVKPARGGSSVGVTKVGTPAGLLPAMAVAFLEDDKLLIEEHITGKEVETAVLEHRVAGASPSTLVRASIPGEILPSGEFYDYEAKYQADGSPVLIPATISPEATLRLQQIAVQAFGLMGCRGLARIDFFVTPREEVILNEINTFPGFTSISMYPILWEKMGMTVSHLLDRLIALALLEQPAGLFFCGTD